MNLIERLFLPDKIHELNRRVREAYPEARVIYEEPSDSDMVVIWIENRDGYAIFTHWNEYDVSLPDFVDLVFRSIKREP
jgi:hypothetical protein